VRPGLSLEMRQESVSDRRIGEGNLQLLASTGDRLNQVGAADGPNKLAVLYDWHALD